MNDKLSNYLITTSELNDAVTNHPENLRIFDTTVDLVPNPPGYKAVSGMDAYLNAHIPGARFLDLIKDLSDTTSGLGFTLPTGDYLQQAYQAAGINEHSQVVFYSTGHMMWATRAWWMLHSCGHKNVAVLDGGFAKWEAEDRPVSQESYSSVTGNMRVNLNPDQWADRTRVLAAIDDVETCTINALSKGVYSGKADMNYGREGHIPGSMNIYYGELLSEGCFKSEKELRSIFTERGVLEKPSVISYCGGGISATIDALALLMVGYDSVSVYDGSMSEWARDESLPLVRGES